MSSYSTRTSIPSTISAPTTSRSTKMGRCNPIKVFEEHSASQYANTRPDPPLPPGFFTNITATPANTPLNILLLDKLNTPLRAQSNLRQQLLHYLDTAQPGTRIALFELTSQLSLLQGFTADRDLLRTALKEKDRPMLPPQSENSGVVGDGPANSGGGGEADAQRSLHRSEITLQALQSLSLYLANVPGRKNLLWFSGDHARRPFPTEGKDISTVSEKEFRAAASQLTANQVAIYPVDARGLMVAPVSSVAVGGEQFVRNPGTLADEHYAFGSNVA